MPDIQLLTQETIDKIAAGEVVERPSSVVKELVENALDAGASAITVEIKEGGISLIRITDNGCGIRREQVPVAFLRHSTSKIRSIDDLLDIHSLGFRGEALSSIAAVARVELITKTPDELTGTRYVMEGSKEMANEEVGAPEGTTFLVRDLFYNTPARRKFLKTATTEGNYICDIVEKLALSHPDVSFKYIQNNQTKLHSSGNGNVKDLIYHIFGREIAAALFPVDYQGEHFSVNGFIGKPVITRGNRNFENYYINGRYVKSNLLAKAIEDAYKNFLMQHQYPFTVLYFTFHGDIDVNVHPTKMEMRFGNNQEVYNDLTNCLFNILSHRDIIPVVPVKEEKKGQESALITGGNLSEDSKLKLPGKALGPEPFEQRRINDIRKSIAKDSPYEYKYPQMKNSANAENNRDNLRGNPANPENSGNHLQEKEAVIGTPNITGDIEASGKPQVVLLRKRVTLSEEAKKAGTAEENPSQKNIAADGSTPYDPMGFMGLSEFFEKTGMLAEKTGTMTKNPEQSGQPSGSRAGQFSQSSETESGQFSQSSESESGQSGKTSGSETEQSGKLSERILHQSGQSLEGTEERYVQPSESTKQQSENTTQPSGQTVNSTSQSDEDNRKRNADAFLSYQQQTLEEISPSFMTKDARRKHRIIGQLFKTYWLVEYEDKLFIIDQHAAHEKVLFEHTMKRLKEKEFTSQTISPPIVMTLDSRETEMLEKYRSQIEAIGYEVEHFGGKEYMITAVPDNLFKINMKDLFIEMLDDFTNITGRETPELILEKVASMSCKAAVKGNDALSLPEVQALFDDLFELDNPYNCPHGRPTIISMTKYEIEKKFKRIV